MSNRPRQHVSLVLLNSFAVREISGGLITFQLSLFLMTSLLGVWGYPVLKLASSKTLLMDIEGKRHPTFCISIYICAVLSKTIDFLFLRWLASRRRFTDGSLLDGDGKQRLDARLRAGTWDSSARPVENSSRSAWQGHPLFGRYYQYPRTCGGCHTFRFEGTFEGLEWFFFFNEEEERWHVGPTIGDDEKILVYDGSFVPRNLIPMTTCFAPQKRFCEQELAFGVGPCNNGMPTPGGQWFCFDSVSEH